LFSAMNKNNIENPEKKWTRFLAVLPLIIFL